MTVGLDAAEEIRLAGAIVAVLSAVGSIFALKDKQRMALNTFLSVDNVFPLFSWLSLARVE